MTRPLPIFLVSYISHYSSYCSCTPFTLAFFRFLEHTKLFLFLGAENLPPQIGLSYLKQVPLSISLCTPHFLEHLLCILISSHHPNCLLIPQICVFMFVLSLECILCKGRDHFQYIHHCISKSLGQHLAPSSYLINICLVDESRK